MNNKIVRVTNIYIFIMALIISGQMIYTIWSCYDVADNELLNKFIYFFQDALIYVFVYNSGIAYGLARTPLAFNELLAIKRNIWIYLYSVSNFITTFIVYYILLMDDIILLEEGLIFSSPIHEIARIFLRMALLFCCLCVGYAIAKKYKLCKSVLLLLIAIGNIVIIFASGTWYEWY